jgi:cyclophilin family peptidyl-prolyl cis-trans isomerase
MEALRMSLGSRLAAALAIGWAVTVLGGCGSGDAVPASIPSPESAAPAVPDRSDPARYDLAPEASQDVAAEPGRPGLSQHPVVAVKTTLGQFTVRLDREHAPVTVDNFLAYAASGFYDGTIFHQAERGFIVAAGGYTEDLKAKPTRTPIRNEAHNGLSNRRKSVAMVRQGDVHSATSQFLINLADNLHLDHKSRELPPEGQPDQYGYCVFGEVVDGWDVVERIAQTPVETRQPFGAVPNPPIVIESVTPLR